MKLVAITGGLGNQMFGYAFMVGLSKNHNSHLFHPYKDNSKKYGHAGYQLEEIFKLRPEDYKKPVGVMALCVYWHIMRIFPKKVRQVMLRLVGIKITKVAQNFVFYPEILQPVKKSELFMGTWQSEKYFQGAEQEVREALTFKENLLNDKTRQLKEKLAQCESVSLHVRRDDYLSSHYAKGFGGICTLPYYKAAVDYIKEHVAIPIFFVFSDDIDWCRVNLDIPNAVFVDWNKGKESWQDLFLMSKCHHNIIANSSFSWWGAWLNSNPNKIVVAPKTWWNGIKDDVVPDNWIRLSGDKKEI